MSRLPPDLAQENDVEKAMRLNGAPDSWDEADRLGVAFVNELFYGEGGRVKQQARLKAMIEAALRSAREQGRREGIEEAIKIECEECRQSGPPQILDMGWWCHVLEGDDLIGCSASKLISLLRSPASDSHDKRAALETEKEPARENGDAK